MRNASKPDQKTPLKVVYLLATQKKGCTAHFGEQLLAGLNRRRPTQVTRFVLPKDGPGFCLGCGTCFFKGMEACPHTEQVNPILEAMCESDLIILAQPTYVMGPPAQVKALMDHLGGRWMVHSPDPRMFNKRVLIMCLAVGGGTRKAARPVKNWFRFLGAARIRLLTFTVGHDRLNDVTEKKRQAIAKKLDRVAHKLAQEEAPRGPSLFVRLGLPGMRLFHQFINRRENKAGRSDTYDHGYWKQQGWLDRKWPWKAV